MKKARVLLLLMTMLVFMSFTVSAMALPGEGTTIIMGTIYNHDYSEKIGGANVTVVCTNGSKVNYRYTTTAVGGDEVGDYQVSFSEFGDDACNGGDSVTVIATKGGLSGAETETVVSSAIMDLDVAVINVPMTPEFGFAMGFMTLISAVGIFFIVRRD